MLADEFPEMNHRSPQSFGGTPVSMLVYAQDVDTFVRRALAAGAKALTPGRTNSTAIGQVAWKTASGITGPSPRTWKMCLPTSWRNAPRPS
jgi:hypothetical protein